MNRLAEILQRKEALQLRCQAQRQELALEVARWRAGMLRVDTLTQMLRRAVASPLMGVVFTALVARLGRSGAGRQRAGRGSTWLGRIRFVMRTARLLGSVAAASRFAPVFLSLLQSVRGNAAQARAHQWRQASR